MNKYFRPVVRVVLLNVAALGYPQKAGLERITVQHLFRIDALAGAMHNDCVVP